MFAVQPYTNRWNQIPGSVRSFLLKAILLFVAWKAVFLLFLSPSRVLDGPLTRFTGVCTTSTLNIFSPSNFSTRPVVDLYNNQGVLDAQPVMAISFQGRRVICIADACNGLELMVLYLGFIICFPAVKSRKWVFASVGIISIMMINIVRCAALAWVYLYHPQYSHFSHHYLFTFLVYACIFCFWIFFSRTPNPKQSYDAAT